MGYVWFVTQVLTQAQEMVTPARGCRSSIQHHQCSKPLKSSQEICTRAFLLCLQQRLKESSFSKCSFYELQGFSPDQVGRTPAESCLNNFLCTTKDKSSSHQGLDRCGSHSSQLDSFTSLALYDVHKVIPYAVSWTPLRWKQSTHSQPEPSSSNSNVSVMNLTTGHFLKVTCKLCPSWFSSLWYRMKT